MAKELIVVSLAQRGEGDVVGHLIHALICELIPENREAPALAAFEQVATQLLSGDFSYWAFLARDSTERPIGVLTLNQCAATYAGGRFGEIAELYVIPENRSLEVGAELLRAAANFGRERGWKRLEVGAPAVPRFQRTVKFYLKNGFVEVGPRLSHTL